MCYKKIPRWIEHYKLTQQNRMREIQIQIFYSDSHSNFYLLYLHKISAKKRQFQEKINKENIGKKKQQKEKSKQGLSLLMEWVAFRSPSLAVFFF